MMIDILDKLYRAFIVIFIIIVSGGWQITYNGKLKNELKKHYLKIIIIIPVFIIDTIFVDEAYKYYLMPIKNILILGIVYLITMKNAKEAIVNIRFNTEVNYSLIPHYLNSLLLKQTLMRYLMFITWLYFICYAVVNSYIIIHYDKQFSAFYIILVDHIFISLFAVVLRPRAIKLFESYFLRRSLLLGIFFDYVVRIKENDLFFTENNYGIILQNSYIPNSSDEIEDSINSINCAVTSGIIPYVIINPFELKRDNVCINHDEKYEILNNISVGIKME